MLNKPRALIATPSLDSRAGGVERFSHSVASAISAEWDVDLMPLSRRSPGWIARLGGGLLWDSRQVRRDLEPRQRPDLLLTNGTLGWGTPRALNRIHVFHGTMPAASLATRGDTRRQRAKSGMGGGLAEFAASRHSVKVAVSNSAAEEAQKFYGARVDLVIENGVDCSMFMPRDRLEARERFGLKATGQPLALFAGRAEPRKGPNIALLAAQEAGFHLLVAGERPIGGALNLGSLSPLDLAWAFAAADCVVFPTSYEACSYVVLEALAVGVPLITTRVGWARDLDQRVPGYEQLLIQPEIKEVAAAMRFSIDNDLTEITGAARHLVRTRNSMEEFSKQWVELANSFLPNL